MKKIIKTKNKINSLINQTFFNGKKNYVLGVLLSTLQPFYKKKPLSALKLINKLNINFMFNNIYTKFTKNTLYQNQLYKDLDYNISLARLYLKHVEKFNIKRTPNVEANINYAKTLIKQAEPLLVEYRKKGSWNRDFSDSASTFNKSFKSFEAQSKFVGEIGSAPKEYNEIFVPALKRVADKTGCKITESKGISQEELCYFLAILGIPSSLYFLGDRFIMLHNNLPHHLAVPHGEIISDIYGTLFNDLSNFDPDQDKILLIEKIEAAKKAQLIVIASLQQSILREQTKLAILEINGDPNSLLNQVD